MKQFLKEHTAWLLFLLLLGLLFILWGRIVIQEISTGAKIHNVTTQKARLNCLLAYGWEGDPATETVKTVTVPQPLDAVYQQYNKLQTACGFNLENYQGKTVQCYTYQVRNFPQGIDEPVYVNLLIYEGTVIGGDCMSTALDGFMIPLCRHDSF